MLLAAQYSVVRSLALQRLGVSRTSAMTTASPHIGSPQHDRIARHQSSVSIVWRRPQGRPLPPSVVVSALWLCLLVLPEIPCHTSRTTVQGPTGGAVSWRDWNRHRVGAETPTRLLAPEEPNLGSVGFGWSWPTCLIGVASPVSGSDLVLLTERAVGSHEGRVVRPFGLAGDEPGPYR